MVIAASGQDVEALGTRGEVRDAFGTPSASGTTADGRAYDEFHTRKKVSDADPLDGLRFMMTLGLYEFVALPAELCRNTWRISVGQTLRFEYDDAGNVTRAPRTGLNKAVDQLRAVNGLPER
jgi:hypothetical protein